MKKPVGKNVAEARDTETRRRISQDLGKNLMVEAAAGTGKTTSIVDRMVSLIIQGVCRIDQLAAVTFTRKASAELRERFQAELRRRVCCASPSLKPAERHRLLQASDQSNQAFVGTIHSFCAALLRQRPVEFAVDPAFRELDEQEESQLREQAWQVTIRDLLAVEDPLIEKLDELGIDRQEIKACFGQFVEYRDVRNWPHAAQQDFDIEDAQRQTLAYIDHMRRLVPHFPVTRGNDKLMGRYENIVRASDKHWRRPGDYFRLLEKFDTSPSAVQSQWHDKMLGKAEKLRWEKFRGEVAKPGMQYWCRVRYEFVVDFFCRALSVYEKLRSASRGLGFNDLLLTAAQGLKSNPELRAYFQARYTHLLVDEFQDTDPIQAETILYLTADDVTQQDWHLCKPRSGSLFLVGDPKQSIYRFRRGDIATYNRVKQIFKSSEGEVLALVKNFRSQPELIEWNNRIFRDKFLAEADAYTPAAEDMVPGRVEQQSPQLDGIYRLPVAQDLGIEQATVQEADAIARFIRHALDSGMTVSRTRREKEMGRTASVEAADFLIIPWGRKRIGLFKEAMDAYGIPCEVSGGNAFEEIEELSLLVDCLRAIDDPYNPVHFLAVLRDRLFGFSDQELFEFKQAGGSFAFTTPLPDELQEPLRSRWQGVCDRFWRYQAWLRGLPFTVAVSRVAQDLGLLAHAAAAADGNVAVGGLFKAIEWLRQRSFDFDSAADLIGFFEELQKTQEVGGCTALPAATNVVRIMNLHKAKGLEAPFVFLADTSLKFDHPVACHIDRSRADAEGYMGIAKRGTYATRDVATPDNWKHFQDEERRYLNAEADRLLYVATTRAACGLVVSVGKDKSNWSGLYDYLSDVPELEIPSEELLKNFRRGFAGEVQAKPRSRSGEDIKAQWTAAARPSYAVVAAKELGLKGVRRPRWETSGDYGYRWGSAVHELLEICRKSPASDLGAAAMTVSNGYDLGSARVSELLATVEAVTQSKVWLRANAASRCYSELPFETVSQDEGGRPVIVRGVIDLIFEEAKGWVIVDYKTDDIPASEVPAAVGYYRGQLEKYAEHFRAQTGFPVVELGVYFTRINQYSSFDAAAH